MWIARKSAERSDGNERGQEQYGKIVLGSEWENRNNEGLIE